VKIPPAKRRTAKTQPRTVSNAASLYQEALRKADELGDPRGMTLRRATDKEQALRRMNIICPADITREFSKPFVVRSRAFDRTEQ